VRRRAPRWKQGIAPDLQAAIVQGAPSDADQIPSAALDLTWLPEADAPQIGTAVRQRLQLVPHHGAPQGPGACARTQVCSAADAASLLVDALRSRKIPARLRYGTIQLDRAGLPWLGVSSPRAAADALALGGVPSQATEEGVLFEHFWASYWNGREWVDLDPTYPRTQAAIQVQSGRSAPDTFYRRYLSDSADDTPAALLRAAPSTSTPRPPKRGYGVLWSVQLRQVPEAYAEQIWVGTTGESRAIAVPMPAALATGILLVPGSEKVAGIDETLQRLGQEAPAYLRRIRTQVVAGGLVWGELVEAVPGSSVSLELTLPAPGSEPQLLHSTMTAGVVAAVVPMAHLPGPRFAENRWKEARTIGDQLSATGAMLFSGLTTESELHARAAGGTLSIGPSVAVVSAGLWGVPAWAGDPLTTRPDGIRMDVARMDQVLVSAGKSSDTPGFSARAGAALSAWEARAVEIAFGIPSVSAVGAIKRSGTPLELKTAAEVQSLALSAGARQEVGDALQAGQIVFVPRAPVRRARWAGETYVLVDPKSGRGAFIVRGALDGAVTADPAAQLVEAARTNASPEARTEDTRRLGRAAAAHGGWPDIWSTPSARPLHGVDALLIHTSHLSGQAPGPPLPLERVADLAPGTLMQLSDGIGVGLGEVSTRIPRGLRSRIPAETPGYDPKTGTYQGAAVLVSVQEGPGRRRITPWPASAVR
jgi:hypothetical protein